MIHQSLQQQAQAVRTKAISPSELTSLHLEQIRQHDPQLRAYVRVFRDEAIATAKRLDGQPADGALFGVPVSVKDSLDVEGVPTYCGSRYRLQHHAAKDATAVQRFRQAGAILLGKTNCPEFLANYETDNAITGWTANPHAPTRSAGGSSGGEAAAIAAYLSAGGIGSDGGGSVRVPAHMCGIAGLKPTPGRCSAAGHYPEIAHPGGLLGVIGPMARTVADVKILFSVMAGYDCDDPFSVPIPIRPASTKGAKLGLIENWCGIPVSDEVKTGLYKAAALFEKQGVAVEPFTPRAMERVIDTWDFFFNVTSDAFKRMTIETNPDLVHWTGQELLQDPPAHPTGVDVLLQLAQRDKLRGSFLRQTQGFTALLLPVCGVPAFLPRQRSWEVGKRQDKIGLFDAMSCSTPMNLFGMPGLAVPISQTAEGLPIGVQLAGAPYAEELLLELGILLENARGPLPGPAGF